MRLSKYKVQLIILTFVFLSGCESMDMLSAFCQDDKENDPLQENPPINVSLNDIWALEAIQQQELILNGLQRPVLEIHLKDSMLMGNDGCNGYFSSIKELDYQNIILGTVGSTQKMCTDMSIPDSFHKTLHKVVSYKLQNLQLRFFDTDGVELLVFRKVD